MAACATHFIDGREASHYADKAVADDLAQGFDLVGHLDLPAGWSTDFRPAFLSLKDLSQLTQETNHQVIKEVEDSSQFLEELWQKSLDEVSKGWSEGPFREQDLPQGAVISKRFAIQQGNKVRPIDDLSQSHINEALNMAYVAVKDPSSGEVRFFRLLCLPFGAVAAVHAFIRVSLAICHIGNTFWHLPWSSFYDDFTLLSTRQLATSAEASACFLLDLLGFEFDRDGDKAAPFQEVFRSLGVEFDLTDSNKQIFRIQNTAERTKSLVEDLAAFQEQGASSPKTWNRLRGRLHFVAGQLSGRLPKTKPPFAQHCRGYDIT
ncbi:unnamed protein product [Symbiodinium natans]|uniref:Uncharacterized protein n=1 Tax=Symbiodinium natans TaxID=878477 RepID=A0A812IDH6_9DINO|nr:unnamed protein product [Symbiodinium natans]